MWSVTEPEISNPFILWTWFYENVSKKRSLDFFDVKHVKKLVLIWIWRKFTILNLLDLAKWVILTCQTWDLIWRRVECRWVGRGYGLEWGELGVLQMDSSAVARCHAPGWLPGAATLPAGWEFVWVHASVLILAPCCKPPLRRIQLNRTDERKHVSTVI